MSKPIFSSLFLFVFFLTVFPHDTTSQAQQPFRCSSPQNTTCNSFIDYALPNTTTLSSLKTLFYIKNLRTLLGANNLDPSTPSNRTLPAKTVVKIPFPCICRNGTGVSNERPIYVVQSGDGLYDIAVDVFSRLVTFQQIAAFNNIPDPNKIDVGQKLRIPLPCSCDDVDGERVVHYGHVVAAGSSFDSIAAEFGSSKEVLMRINGIANESSLLAGQVLDVPLRACNSSIRSDAVDNGLLVANGTYIFTANSCVRCKCDSANNWTLQCEPSGLRPSDWPTCPSMQCAGTQNLSLGNTTTSGCNSTKCAYAGFYSNQTVLTTLATESTCPVNSPNSPDSYAAHMSWSFLSISIHLSLLFAHLFW